MRISVIGCGYLGAVHAACMADLGHDVVGIDVDSEKVTRLGAGDPPFHEPGFTEVLQRVIAQGRLKFTTDYAAAATARVHFIGVGTPQQQGSYGADMRYVDAAVTSLLPYLGTDPEVRDVVVGKSTVPVGTASRLAEMVADSRPEGVLVWNPEFLREGHAVADTVSPDRLVYGLPENVDRATTGQTVLDEVYASILERGTPRMVTDYATAELVKVAANSFLATKISFINAMAELCEITGADVTQLAEAIGHDDRIGAKFLRAGIGFGGGCLPKDIRAFMARAGELGAEQSLTFLREVDSINGRRRDHVVDLALQACDGAFTGKQVAVLGAAFKPQSDDIRDSPALDVASRIAGRGASVRIVDPAAGPRLQREHPHLNVVDDAFAAARDSDVVLLLTEWPEFVSLDPETLAGVVGTPSIIDGRNVLDPTAWRAAGWTYRGLGRP